MAGVGPDGGMGAPADSPSGGRIAYPGAQQPVATDGAQPVATDEALVRPDPQSLTEAVPAPSDPQSLTHSPQRAQPIAGWELAIGDAGRPLPPDSCHPRPQVAG